MAEIETIILQASNEYKTQIAGNIFSMSEDLQNIIQEDIENQVYHIQTVIATTYHEGQIITQQVNLLVRYNMGVSQENLTRSLFFISVLFIQSVHGLCYQ